MIRSVPIFPKVPFLNNKSEMADISYVNSLLPQVKQDYLSRDLPSLSEETALRLCCLAMRHYFRDMHQIALDKKSNLECLEKEIGLAKFLPAGIISKTKQKTLRKLIQQNFKKCASLSHPECMIQFLETMKTVYRYDQERFDGNIGVSKKFHL